MKMPVHQDLTDLGGGHPVGRMMLRFPEVMLQLMEGNAEADCRPQGPAGQPGQSDSSKLHGVHRAIVEDPPGIVKEAV